MKVHLLEPLEISDEQLDEFEDKLKEAGHSFKAYDEKTTDANELYERSKDADVVIIANNPYPKEVVDKLEKTKFIQVAFTGLDHVALESAEEKSIEVKNAAGYSDQAVAELVIGLTLDVYRKITKGNAHIRQGGDSQGFIGQEIKDKTVGIVGTGNIGLNTARLFKAFGAKLIATSRSEKEEALELGIEYFDLHDMLSQADIVTIHLPLNKHTQGYFDEAAFDAMKKDAILINAARGPIVDTQALIEALKSKKIAAAAIDVYDNEPPLDPQSELFTLDNLITTPHVAYYTKEAMVRRAEIAFSNVLDFVHQNA
ncbi:MAG: NAD(P)-dependent oxidoreductase [Coriobacteriia bacterium]|nr:NAD(P)-dependent oxidoreductase [Coriobacteriia bacterium]